MIDVLNFPITLFDARSEKKRVPVVRSTHKDRKRLACIHCRTPITANEARIEVNASHDHCFFNPHGVVFRIGCFSEAPGCGETGAISSEFSWFPGFLWRIAVCGGCQTHLGWRFLKSVGSESFYGLILDKLTEVTLSESSGG